MVVHTSTKRIKEILDVKCEAADLDQVCAWQEHLSPTQRQQLKRLLDKCAELFDGTLGTWNLEPVELELKPDATPHHARPCPIPRVHQETLKMEVERLCKIGVLKKVNRSEWAATMLSCRQIQSNHALWSFPLGNLRCNVCRWVCAIALTSFRRKCRNSLRLQFKS